MAGSGGSADSTNRAPSVRSFQCPKCAAALTVRGLQQTEAIACGSCGSVVDITDENLRILSTYQAKVRYEPLIPLGTRGTVRGETFEVIGFMRRSITVEGVDYEWSEYLLFNPYKGFRWLTEYNGHWNFVKTTTNVPTASDAGSAVFLGQTFRHFQTATAQVTYVVGEFYWRVQVGESCEVTDYVAPPLILSREQSAAEVTWSAGEYIEPEVLWRSFGLKTPPPARIGVAPNQPSPFAGDAARIWKVFGALALVAVALQLVFYFTAQNRVVFEKTFDFQATDKGKIEVTPTFELRGRASNVAVRSSADVDNSFLFLGMALISLEEDGRSYDFGREISYYHGVEDGESWSEGATSDEAVLPAVPPGRYYLRIEPDSESSRVQYTVQVFRDTPQVSFLFLALGGLGLYPLIFWLRGRSFEVRRWSESDHSSGGGSTEEADDSDDED